MRARWLVTGAVLLIGMAVLASAFVLGLARSPWGGAPSRVLSGTACPQDGEDVIVEGPRDRSVEEAAMYPPGRDWSLLGYELEDELGVTYTWSAERKIRASLPWRVRFGVEWDSEGGLLAAYGNREQICMMARVVQWRRGSRRAFRACADLSEGRPHSGQAAATRRTRVAGVHARPKGEATSTRPPPHASASPFDVRPL